MTRKKNKDLELLSLWIENGIDIEKRRVFFEDEVDDCTVGPIIRALMIMIEKDDTAPIDIYISSYGGYCYDGLALYDVIRNLPCEVRTHAVGKQMSMGLILFLAGDKRFCSDNSTLMAHSVASGTGGKLFAMKTDVKETSRLNELLVKILAERTKVKDEKWWRKETKYEDNFYTKEKALELGIVTEE